MTLSLNLFQTAFLMCDKNFYLFFCSIFTFLVSCFPSY